MRTALLVAAVVLAFLGCGGAREGGPCSGAVYRCDGPSTVLECRDGAWFALPCSGTKGCSSVAGGVSCDITSNAVGDACPTAMEGTGFCRGSPPSIFACQDLQLVKVADCSSCIVGTGSIVCNP